MTHRQRGFTLIELLIVVAIIGIIAAIAVPNLVNAVDRSKQRKTMADMKAIGTACEQYQIDLNFYPRQAAIQAIDASIAGYLENGGYIPRLPRTDGWGHAMKYGTDQAGRRYTLWSPGKDGVYDAPPKYGETTEFDCDIVFMDGAFTAVPTGPQK